MRKTATSLTALIAILLPQITRAGPRFCDEYKDAKEKNVCASKYGEEYFMGKSWVAYRDRHLEGIDASKSTYNRDVWFGLATYGSTVAVRDSEGKRQDYLLYSGVQRRVAGYVWNKKDPRWSQFEGEIRLGMGVQFVLEKRDKPLKLEVAGLGSANTQPSTYPSYTPKTDVYGETVLVLKILPLEGQYHFRHDFSNPTHAVTVGGRF